MNARWSTLILWTPRVLGVLTTLFFAMFAADVFNEGHSVWQALPAFFLHIIPSLLLLAVVVLSWRWMWIGGVVFSVLGVLYAVWNITSHPDWVGAISGPLLAVGILYIASWTLRAKELRTQRGR
jgi:hypothetical protein